MPVESFDASDVSSVDDLKGFQSVEAGQYHLVVVDVDESREKSNAIVVKFAVLAGTTSGQENRTFKDFFNDPNPDSKDGGKFARNRRLKLLLAAGIITPEHLGKPFNVDWQWLMERQLKAAVKIRETEDKNDSTKKYQNPQIDGLSMWGPLDEEAKHIPHDNACIEAAVRAGQVNVVSKYRGAAPVAGQTAVAGTAPAPAAATAPTASTGLPPAVDKYAGL